MILKNYCHAVIKAAASSDTGVVSETVKGGGLRGKLNKVVLAYSGGLDTSVIVPWLRYICCSSFSFSIFLLDFRCKFAILDFPSLVLYYDVQMINTNQFRDQVDFITDFSSKKNVKIFLRMCKQKSETILEILLMIF